jgi:hypothetical protein
LDTTVRKTAPDGHKDCRDNDRTNQRDAAYQWFTSNLKVEDPNDQKNGE